MKTLWVGGIIACIFHMELMVSTPDDIYGNGRGKKDARKKRKQQISEKRHEFRDHKDGKSNERIS